MMNTTAITTTLNCSRDVKSAVITGVEALFKNQYPPMAMNPNSKMNKKAHFDFSRNVNRSIPSRLIGISPSRDRGF